MPDFELALSAIIHSLAAGIEVEGQRYMIRIPEVPCCLAGSGEMRKEVLTGLGRIRSFILYAKTMLVPA